MEHVQKRMEKILLDWQDGQNLQMENLLEEKQEDLLGPQLINCKSFMAMLQYKTLRQQDKAKKYQRQNEIQ